jgi:hypothetical protein
MHFLFVSFYITETSAPEMGYIRALSSILCQYYSVRIPRCPPFPSARHMYFLTFKLRAQLFATSCIYNGQRPRRQSSSILDAEMSLGPETD